ncbi:HET domain protein [Apiospora arundinis]
MVDYVYQALSAQDTIRIIGLQPSEESSNIRITLRDYPVSSSPEFEALSYVWGTGVRDHVIEC